MFEGINEVAVLVTSLLSVAVGSIWYSPLVFGEQWMRSAGIHREDLEVTPRQIGLRVLVGLIANILLFFILAWFVREAKDGDLSLMGIGVSLTFFIATSMVSMVMWEKRSWWYIVVHSGYAGTIILGGLGIIAYWPW